MDQTITQNINIQIANSSSAGTGSSTGTSQQTGKLSNTGATTTATITIVAIALIAFTVLIWRLSSNKSKYLKHFKNARIMSIFSLLALAVVGAVVGLVFTSRTNATPTLTLGSNQNTINITIPEGGGTATDTSTLTSGTTSSDGYKLTAQLTASEPGIAIKLKGGDVTTSTALTPNATPLELKTTTTTTSNDQTEITLDFTIDGTVTPGTKELKLNYQITDNEPSIPPTPTTMQSMTSAYCSTMTVYDGNNEEAIINLTDNRGDIPRTYQVAKLADNKCWMLSNLKLGSISGSTTLTPADTDIATDFTLPQVVATGTADYDNPGVYGPVPNDTGTGATNYGYLYNWSAATAGESRASHDETAGDAPYSICPKNWRLPTSNFTYDEILDEVTSTSGDFSDLDKAFGGNGMYADNGEPNIAKWQSDGPFKGVLAGFWWEGFGNQGGLGVLWSSSANPGGADGAVGAVFDAGGVNPVGGNRASGVGVRCLLNN